MRKRPYSKYIRIPLETIDKNSMSELTNDDYEMMWEFVYRKLKYNAEQTNETLQNILLRYANQMEKNKDIRLTGNYFVKVVNSVIINAGKAIKYEESQGLSVGEHMIDDRDDAKDKLETEHKLFLIDQALQELPQHQSELYLYSLQVPLKTLAEYLEIPIHKLKKEIKQTQEYILNYCETFKNKGLKN